MPLATLYRQSRVNHYTNEEEGKVATEDMRIAVVVAYAQVSRGRKACRRVNGNLVHDRSACQARKHEGGLDIGEIMIAQP